MTENYRILGIDMGGTNIRAGIVEDGLLNEVLSIPTPASATRDIVMDALCGLILKFGQSSVDAIGIGVPTIVDVKNGIVYNATNIKDWAEVPLKQILEERFGISVFVNNDANCFAAGEKHFGKARGYTSMVGLVLGTGLGAGLIINNKLYEGRNCGAGEICNLPYLEHNYEYYCSGQYFKNELNFPAHEAFQQAEAGNKEALSMFGKFGIHVGKLMQAILYVYDPEVIIMGGSVSRAFKYFQKSMYLSMEEGCVFPNSLKNLKIEISELENVAIYGAAALVFENEILLKSV